MIIAHEKHLSRTALERDIQPVYSLQLPHYKDDLSRIASQYPLEPGRFNQRVRPRCFPSRAYLRAASGLVDLNSCSPPPMHSSI